MLIPPSLKELLKDNAKVCYIAHIAFFKVWLISFSLTNVTCFNESLSEISRSAHKSIHRPTKSPAMIVGAKLKRRLRHDKSRLQFYCGIKAARMAQFVDGANWSRNGLSSKGDSELLKVCRVIPNIQSQIISVYWNEWAQREY